MAILYSLIKLQLKLTLYTTIALVVIAFIPNDLKIVNNNSERVAASPPLTGPLSVNDGLNSQKILFKGKVRGPESIATDAKGNLYTGSIGGNVYKISNNGQNIDLLVNIRADGRPLGIRVDSHDDNLLHVLDAFVGIYTVNIKTKSVSVLYNMTDDTVDHGRKMLFIDDFVKIGNKVYITDSMAGFTESSCFLAVISYDTTGRVIEYDTVTKKVTELSSDLAFPNGIEVTDDGDAVLVVELTRSVLWKVFIKGEKRGQRVKVIDNLPGWADNIRRSSRRDRETHWIAFFNNAENLRHFYMLSEYPTVARYITNLIYNLAKGVEFVSGKIKSLELPQLEIVAQKLDETAGFLETGGIAMVGLQSYGLVIEVDPNSGEIIQSLHSPNGDCSVLSEARDVVEGDNRILYLGSAFNDYIGKVNLGKVTPVKVEGKKVINTPPAAKSTPVKAAASAPVKAEAKATESKRKSESTGRSSSTTASSTNNGETVKLSKTKSASDSVSSESTAKSSVGSAKENAAKGSNK